MLPTLITAIQWQVVMFVFEMIPKEACDKGYVCEEDPAGGHGR